MDASPPLAPSAPNLVARPLPPDVEAYLSRITVEHRRLLGALGEAHRDLAGTSGQLTKVAAIQTRLTQEFLDAQRAIVKRRAETDADVADIAATAERDAEEVLRDARSRACIAVGRALPAPSPGTWAAPMPGHPRSEMVRPSIPTSSGSANDSLARLIDGAFESNGPDGAGVRRELRELLDAWWEAEKQEAKEAVDDATARAAMRVHVAKVEAGEIARFAPPSPSLAPNATIAYRYQPPTSLPSPLVAALDDTDHEHLDDVLAHLLDELGAPATPARWPDGDADERADLGTAGFAPPAMPRAIVTPALPPPADSLNDRSAAPQEAFDRFWTGFRSGTSTRRWLFPQLLLPAVAVIAVLALVLAVTG